MRAGCEKFPSDYTLDKLATAIYVSLHYFKIVTKRGVGFHLLVARLHSNLSLLTPVCEVVVSGTDIVVHSCCPESQQSPFKGCRGIVQELLEWRVK